MAPRSSSTPASTGPKRNEFVISVARGGRERRLAVPSAVMYGAAVAVPLVGALYLGATGYLFFRDDMVAALMARQARQQYAYEDRLAALRLQLDQVAARQMLDQDSFDGKLRDIASRQARIETRAALIASLGEVAGLPANPAEAGASAIARALKNAPSATETLKARTMPLEAYAPIAREPSSRPRPEDAGLRPSADDGTFGPRADASLSDQAGSQSAASVDAPPGLRIRTLNASLDRVEQVQIGSLRRLEGPAVAEAARLRHALNETGLSADRLKRAGSSLSAMGGPFVPLQIDPKASDFDAQLARTQAAVLSLGTLRRVLPSLPVRPPLHGALEQTSSFGYRLDPFLGRPALHSGLDFRGEHGSPVRATAGGAVVTAGWSGGYGNLVEIDHGNGVSTRYGHLSSILVSEGQKVEPGMMVGRLGSTGRSTGNHLHYEVRLDDEAVDPTRFIRAAKMLAD